MVVVIVVAVMRWFLLGNHLHDLHLLSASRRRQEEYMESGYDVQPEMLGYLLNVFFNALFR